MGATHDVDRNAGDDGDGGAGDSGAGDGRETQEDERGLDEDLAHAVATLVPGGKLLRSVALEGGVSATVRGLEIAGPTSAHRVVFRRHRAREFKGGGADVIRLEFEVMSSLRRAGLPVPEPLLFDEGTSTGRPFVILEWVDGSTSIASRDLPDALGQMAAFLAELHHLDADEVGCGPIDDLARPWPAVLDHLVDARLRRDVDRALSSRIPRPNPPAIVHGDFWPGNVLWRDDRLVAVVDWEDVAFADPLADLATARVELYCAFGRQAAESFTRAYLDAADPPDLDDLALWETYASATALGSMDQWGLDPVDEARRRAATTDFLAAAVHRLGG